MPPRASGKPPAFAEDSVWVRPVGLETGYRGASGTLGSVAQSLLGEDRQVTRRHSTERLFLFARPRSLDQQHSDLKALLKLSQEFVLHSLRHKFGTRLGESGADAFTIMRLMGHSGVTVSQRDVHPSPELIERLEALNERKGLEGVKWQQLGTESGTVTDPAPAAVQ